MADGKENSFQPHAANFVTGIRGASYLVDQCNYQYTFNKDGVDGAKFYACTQKRNGCLGKATVKAGLIVRLVAHNDHEPKLFEVAVKQKMSAMMDALKVNPNTKTDTLVTNFLKSTLSLEERAAVGSKKSLERRIQRQKAAILQRPPNPRSLESLVELPSSHSTTVDGERFLLSNFINNGKRNLIFASRRGLDMLRKATSLGGDGTFDIPPELFYQVYLILAELDHVSYPVVFCLLGDKKASTYKLLFEEIRKAMLRPLPEDTPLPNPPKCFYVDFEIGCINQFKSVFPEIKEIRGCLVHLKRNMTKMRQQLGKLSTWYRKSKKFHSLVNALYNLAYVPPDLVSTYYQALLDEELPSVVQEIEAYTTKENEVDEQGNSMTLDCDDIEELKACVNKYLQYIEDNYVGGRTRTGWSVPRFPINIWNHHQSALEMGQSSTNRNEGRNSNLRSAIPINAGLWQVIEGFRDLEAKTRTVRDEDTARIPLGGRPVDPNTGDIIGPASGRDRLKSIHDFKLKNIVEHRSEYSHADYLKRLSEF